MERNIIDWESGNGGARRWRAAFGALLVCVSSRCAGAGAEPDFARDIKPVLKEHCVSCHGQLKQNGELRLDAGALIAQGGEHGAAVLARRSGESLLIRRVSASDAEERMPKDAAPLPPDKIELLRRWIDSGARYPEDEVVTRTPADHWSFQPLQEQPVPRVRDASWARNPIDAFVLAKLEAQQLQPAPAAAPMALLRRLHLDLAGIPPTLAEQDELAGHPGDDALDRVVDQLLARPGYGERWARHWLDVVRYADSNGYERDAEKPFVWRYRDYVIDSLNRDKPFDRFVMEQIAGDEVPGRTAETMIATGFLRLGHWDDEPADPVMDRFDQLDDIVSTTGQAFLGLTIGCARCHDHKFEPLTARDYYGLVAVFNPLERPREGRTELTIPVGADKSAAYIWKESAAPAPETRVLLRGSPGNPGELVDPAVPAVLVNRQPRFLPPGEQSAHRRLGLARWIASPDNPLTARVIVNRVWQQHFGRGLVTSANDFGLMGEPPSHPELLDWLAHWFVHDARWSMKELHRLILTSNAWRMSAGKERSETETSTGRNPSRASASPAPAYCFRRLEVESIRDSMLAVSGQLNLKRQGPAMKPRVSPAALEANTDKEKVWSASNEPEASRRTIYAFVKRGLVLPLLEVLDLADTVSSCPQRQVTTVAPQALSLFNGEFVNQQARHFASRLVREAGDDPAKQVRLAWRLALCREPSAAELMKMTKFLEQEPLEQVCRVILNLNEFVYPE